MTMAIGLTAYGLDPNRVFVRVPTERGRWVLTDRCVIEVQCDICDADVGEPCRVFKRYKSPAQHGAGTHVTRRNAWQSIKNTRPRIPPNQHMRAEDYAAGGMEPEAADSIGIDIDIDVTRKTP